MVTSNYSTFANILDSLAVVALIAALGMVVAKRMGRMIRIVAVQAWVLAAIAATVGYYTGNSHMYLAALMTVLVKALAIPWFTLYIVDRIEVCRDAEQYLSSKASLLIAVGLIMLSYYVVTPEVSLGESLAANCLPISLALVLVGLFVMITRKKAIAQMMGLMLMENGLFLVAIAITSGMPLVVELGIFFDLFLGVLIMGILAFRINRTFDSINVNRLQKLKG
ncbi:MAG TPA: NADH-quinone oxidoreductase subunit K [Bacillota bacterium]|nr:NADH-quinone oxidoreductase subunit K [Bacillota bacterium]